MTVSDWGVAEPWTLPELVAEVAARLAALPAPKNGQVRAVPDDRTVRYYGTIGLLDRPLAMRGRTALYGVKHLAQVVAIKRMQQMGRSLGEVQQLWTTLDDATLTRMSGVALEASASPAEFWKRAPAPAAITPADRVLDALRPASGIEMRLELAPGLTISIPLPISDSGGPRSLSPTDLAAIRAAAAPLITELAQRQLIPHDRDVVGRSKP